jgi:hypothetical protein
LAGAGCGAPSPSDPIDSPDFQECILEDATALRRSPAERSSQIQNNGFSNNVVTRSLMYGYPHLFSVALDVCTINLCTVCTTVCISQTTWSQSIPLHGNVSHQPTILRGLFGSRRAAASRYCSPPHAITSRALGEQARFERAAHGHKLVWRRYLSRYPDPRRHRSAVIRLSPQARGQPLADGRRRLEWAGLGEDKLLLQCAGDGFCPRCRPGVCHGRLRRNGGMPIHSQYQE